MSNYPSLDRALTDLGNKADRCRQDLYYCDVTLSRPERRALKQDVQASTYVLLGAAIEQFTRSLVNAVMDEISAQAIPHSDLALNLLAISIGGPFLALQDVRGLKMWRKRIELLEHAESQQVATLPNDHMPLDGKTIRPDHYDVIWLVFGFAGPSLPDPRTGLALKMIADYRNLVAHGDEDTATVAGLLPVDAVLRLIDQIDGLGVHVYDAAVDFLDNRRYLR
ncbi:hypothetical protein GR927_19120 [Mycolicibacterium sp. 3033]|nr:hypothetical protein [Mycolicibacterium aurantiacum]